MIALIYSTDQLILTVTSALLLALIGWLGVKLSRVFRSFLFRLPLESSNEILRITMQDYKEAALLTAQQKEELNEVIKELREELADCRKAAERQIRAIAVLTLKNQDLTARVQELEKVHP